MPRTLYPWDQKTNAPSFYELTSPLQDIFGTKSQENTSLCYPEDVFFDSQGIPITLSSFLIVLVLV